MSSSPDVDRWWQDTREREWNQPMNDLMKRMEDFERKVHAFEDVVCVCEQVQQGGETP